MEMQGSYDAPLPTTLEQLASPDHHLCSIYETAEEHFAVAIPFIRIGLERGEKAIYIADDGSEEVVRDALQAEGIDVEKGMAAGSLVVKTKGDAYLKNGSFDPDWMLTFWKDATAEATRQGFSALRATGETEWVLRAAPPLERWLEYESRVTQTVAGLKCFVLCQYDRQLISPEVALDVIRTHPTIIYRGVVCRNMYFVPADELLGTTEPAREAERLLTTIRERAEIEYTLRQQRNELRSLANRLLHARDDERRRVATMLHETSAQDLAALKMLLVRLNRAADRLTEGERIMLSESISLAEQSIAGIRTASYLLHPPVLDDVGLLSAVRWYADGFAERSDIKMDLDLPENLERMAVETETVLLRIIQESLTNIHRHSGSQTASIRLRRDPAALVLEIQDRGRGIPDASLRHITSGGSAGGVGIASMNERIQQLGGSLEITSGTTGTTVRVRLPLANEV